MNKKLIRLTEQDLHRIVKESASRIVNEVISVQDEESIDVARKSLERIRPLYYQAIKSINALMAECEKFPMESIKQGSMLPGCRLAKEKLELFFDKLV